MILDHNREPAVNPADFRLIENIETSMATAQPIVEENTRINIARDLPKLHHRPDYGMWKGRPLAIVGGGPSLKTTLCELREFSDVMVCGSAHDYVVGHGIIPKYAVACEPNNAPGDSVLDFIRNPQKQTEYLFSTSCHPTVFENMADFKVCMWNNAGGVDDKVFNNEPSVNGGCTVTLRAIYLAIVLGYHDLHMFGFDSSFENDIENHAYFSGPGDEKNWGQWLWVRVGDEFGRQFKTTRGWIAQAFHFQQMLEHTGWMFNPVIHGDGLIAEIMHQRRKYQRDQIGVTQ